MFIAPNKSVTSIAGCVVVEVTPWVKVNHPDWTVGYINSLKGHKVRITGWLMYDFEHTNVSAASKPDMANPSRGTVWEVHPITNIEDLDGDSGADAGDGSDASDANNQPEEITPTSGPVYRSAPQAAGTSTPATSKTPGQILIMILLGAVLGVTGQFIRIAVGLKKLNDASENKANFDEQFDIKKLMVSVLYAVIIGIVCGVLMAVDSIDKLWDKSSILAIIAAGYAGVDFIEAFVSKSLPGSGSSTSDPDKNKTKDTIPKTPATKVVTGPAKEGGIPQ